MDVIPTSALDATGTTTEVPSGDRRSRIGGLMSGRTAAVRPVPGAGPPPAPNPTGDNGSGGDGTGSSPEEGEKAGLGRRRAILGGAIAAGVAGVGLLAKQTLFKSKPTSAKMRPAAAQPSEEAPFADRDESFTQAAAPTATTAPLPDNVYDSASAAAEATEVSGVTLLATDDPSLHLLRRTTFGATPAMVADIHEVGIDAWLAKQLDPSSIDDGTADGLWGQLPLASKSSTEIQRSIEQYDWEAMFAYGQATIARQVWSNRQLFEVMVDFWSDHLHVPVPGGAAWDVGPSYYNEVIRGNALGSFKEMLLAAMQHPAMLRYLSNTESHKDAVNENLGRELLELHTVGVGSGYTEDDVRNSAYILTGRTEVSYYDAEQGRGTASSFIYDPTRHWTGGVKVLDFTHANGDANAGLDVGDAYLNYLATHPSTARTIARKLVVRFVSDTPPDSLVDRLATQFIESDTEIKPVLDLMFRSAEFWAAVGQKTKRPLENMVSSLRTADAPAPPNAPEALEGLYWWTHDMGHSPLAWPAPNGYADVHGAWRSAGGLLHTWRFHLGLMQDWVNGMAEYKAETLVGDGPQATMGEYVDTLCKRLCQQTFQEPHRNALLAFMDAQAGTPVGQTELEWKIDHLAGLVLSSPYFALR
jgi:uncharacterized protein (DUF1800 family)